MAAGAGYCAVLNPTGTLELEEAADDEPYIYIYIFRRAGAIFADNIIDNIYLPVNTLLLIAF